MRGLACALIVVLAGCSAADKISVHDELAGWRPARRGTRTGLSVTFGPLEASKEAFAPFPNNPYSRALAIDPAALRVELATAIEDAETFKQVRDATFVKDLAAREASQLLPPGRGHAAPIGTDELLDGAFERGDDLLLTLRFTTHGAGYVDRNGWFVLNLINFAFNVWPAWFVADETYEARIGFTVTLRSTGTGTVLWEKAYEAKDVRALDHFDRGWKFFGSLTVPDSLDDENYERVGALLAPHALVQLGRELATDLAALGPELLDPKAQAKSAKTLAVVAGVGKYADRAIEDHRSATNDAQGVASLLSAPEKGGLPARLVTQLLDERATKVAILRELASAAKRARPEDTLVVFFAGYGAAIDGSPCLAPFDAELARPETFLTLDEIARALEGNARHKALLVDASFGHAARGVRSIALGGAAPAPAALAGRLRQLTGITIALASEPGEGAGEARLEKHGLFTAALLQAAGEGPDDDKDGVLTLAEVFAHARTLVRERASKMGYRQEPSLFGVGAREIRLVAAPREK